MPRYVVAIDPSIASCGVAVWEFTNWRKWENITPPDQVHLWHPILRNPKEATWDAKLTWMAQRFDELLEVLGDVKTVGCELPMLVRGGGGDVVASSGALVKLSCCVGAFAGVCAVKDVEFLPIPVYEWKGQLPKDIVNRRIRQLLGNENCRKFKRDIWDAVGIGLHMKGVGF